MPDKGVVLLVEDNEKLNSANARALTLRGYETYTALTLAEARAQLAQIEPDVILLDVMLPDGSGFDFCDEIRKQTRAHILFLTAKTEHEDRIRGLVTGGDDYIIKPFHPEELMARVSAAVRRQGMGKVLAKTLVKGSLVLDLIALRAYLNGKDMLLAGKEFSLLLLLIQHEGETLSKKYLYEAAWSQPLAGDGNAVWVQLSRLKAKLEAGSGGKITIASHRNAGYTLEIN